MWDFEGDKIIIKKLAQRIAWTVWQWQQHDGTPGITQTLPSPVENSTMPSIPEKKLLRFTFRQEGDNYEGRSVLRSAYKHWYIKDTLYKLDAVRHERLSIGIPVVTLPKNPSDEDKLEAELIAANIRSTEQSYVIKPNGDWGFEFADMKASSTLSPNESIGHHNREITKNILAQFLEL